MSLSISGDKSCCCFSSLKHQLVFLIQLRQVKKLYHQVFFSLKYSKIYHKSAAPGGIELLILEPASNNEK
jgi:hypothetical protein